MEVLLPAYLVPQLEDVEIVELSCRFVHFLLLIDFLFNPLNHLLFSLDLLPDALIFVLHLLDL